LLTAKINNKIYITISDRINTTSYRNQLLMPYDTKKLIKGLYIFAKHFYKHL